MRRPRAAGATLLLALIGLPGLRDAPAESLSQAWSLALSQNRGYAATGSDLEAAVAGERAARAARWPSLTANAGYTRLQNGPSLDVVSPGMDFHSGPIFHDDQYVSGSVQMMLPLYAGGQISAGIDAAHSAVASATAAAGAAAGRLKLQVAQAYVEVLRAQRALAAARSDTASLQANVEDAQQRVHTQSSPLSDLLAAQVALANAEQVQVHAASELQQDQAAYNRLLGEPLDRAVELEPEIPTDPTLAGLPLETLVQRALAGRMELRGAAAEVDALASQSRAAAGRLLPQLALTGGYTHFDNQILDRENFAMVGVGLSWSLFDAGRVRDEARALDDQSRAQRGRLEDLRAQIGLEVRESWLALRDAQARLRASSQSVALAEENLHDSRELYGTGLATNTQVLDAVALRTRAVSNRDDATLDASMALLRLAYAVGGL